MRDIITYQSVFREVTGKDIPVNWKKRAVLFIQNYTQMLQYKNRIDQARSQLLLKRDNLVKTVRYEDDFVPANPNTKSPQELVESNLDILNVQSSILEEFISQIEETMGKLSEEDRNIITLPQKQLNEAELSASKRKKTLILNRIKFDFVKFD